MHGYNFLFYKCLWWNYCTRTVHEHCQHLPWQKPLSAQSLLLQKNIIFSKLRVYFISFTFMSSTFVLFRNCSNKLHSLISEKNDIKLSGLLFIFFLEVLPVLLSRETVSLDSVIWCLVTQNWGETYPPLVPSLCTEHTFRFGAILKLPLIFTSFAFQSSSVFSLFYFYLYSWGPISYFNFLCNCFLNSDLQVSFLCWPVSFFTSSKCLDYLDFRWLTLLYFKWDMGSRGKRHVPCIGMCDLARGWSCPSLSLGMVLGTLSLAAWSGERESPELHSASGIFLQDIYRMISVFQDGCDNLRCLISLRETTILKLLFILLWSISLEVVFP